MKCYLLSLFALGASAGTVTPVQKVIQMLTEMSAKAKKERADEQIMYSAFNQFCVSLTFSIVTIILYN